MSLTLLDEKTADPDPIRQFRLWYAEASASPGTHHEAMTLATATRDGVPSARTVLLKGVDERGFLFFTNYNSRKGKELADNPRAALLFFWPQLNRSVRIEGIVGMVSAEESNAYFASRRREGQLSSLASSQSEDVADRETLDRRFDALARENEGKTVARPPHWGGYRITPVRMEFWQARYARMNDRVQYALQEGKWVRKRLQP